MKLKLVLIIISVILTNSLYSQISSSPDNSVNAIEGASNVIPSGIDNSGGWSSTNAYWASPLIYRSMREPNDGSGTFPFNQYGELMIQGTSHGSGYNKGISLLTWDGSASIAQIRMRIDKNGHVGIGTIETGTHKLAVDGTIGAREIKVEANGWSDFVFENDYKLKALEEVESFIEENKHLPDVPSEKEVMENGIALGEMDAKLLQKIEELTLYIIEQNKKTEELIKEVQGLKNENELLNEKIIKLETAE